ncbi:BLUF domain-containing protein [Pseudooctadecabacter jejudonensis]|uniref:Blue light-and temperature-regulated antirepressor YcgF n=1 Tax=Pseudooctadecabacter jejudonensis TaxID=1391910 RepID=A0A1Y5TJ56_9RHOB|nr:BLUF domain-containing protein [Pseudooctadecabacter jejudonensis]SLN61613.1 Blue light-and temperature-regulated antirepressor YcgF [Pseudooctadecabacter jejudonensis]
MHLISYVSTSLVPPRFAEAELTNITKTAVRRNARTDITGVLFFQGEHFFQVIEGEKANLDRLYAELEDDPRHRNLVKLIDQPIPARQLSDWSMDSFFVDNPEIVNPKTLALIQALYTHNFGIDAPDLIEFTKRMIDEMDTYRIEREPMMRLN